MPVELARKRALYFSDEFAKPSSHLRDWHGIRIWCAKMPFSFTFFREMA
jgi:hypothetical protein